jgi:hypothetical protein
MIRVVLSAIGLWFGLEILFLGAMFGRAAWEEKHRLSTRSGQNH